MPYQRVFSSYAAVGGAPTNAVETVVATSPAVNTGGPGANVRLHFDGVVTPGATATALVLKVERGTAAGGTQVGATKTINCVAATPISVSIDVNDIIGEVAGQQWVLTVTQTGGSGAGSSAAMACNAITD